MGEKTNIEVSRPGTARPIARGILALLAGIHLQTQATRGVQLFDRSASYGPGDTFTAGSCRFRATRDAYRYLCDHLEADPASVERDPYPEGTGPIGPYTPPPTLGDIQARCRGICRNYGDKLTELCKCSQDGIEQASAVLPEGFSQAQINQLRGCLDTRADLTHGIRGVDGRRRADSRFTYRAFHAAISACPANRMAFHEVAAHAYHMARSLGLEEEPGARARTEQDDITTLNLLKTLHRQCRENLLDEAFSSLMNVPALALAQEHAILTAIERTHGVHRLFEDPGTPPAVALPLAARLTRGRVFDKACEILGLRSPCGIDTCETLVCRLWDSMGGSVDHASARDFRREIPCPAPAASGSPHAARGGTQGSRTH